MGIGTNLNMVTVAPTVNVQIVPRQWQALGLAQFTLVAGTTVTKTITNNTGVKAYVGFISVKGEGGVITVSATPPPPNIKQVLITGATNPTVKFDYKEGLGLEPLQTIDIELISQDLSDQIIEIDYLWSA